MGEMEGRFVILAIQSKRDERSDLNKVVANFGTKE